MNKSNLKKKLKSYSALAGSIAAASAANAQIVYTDITPDTTLNVDGALYNLDLNNDGTFDFGFALTMTPAGSGTSNPAANLVTMTANPGNGVAGSVGGSASNYLYPFALNAGDTVKSSLTWNLNGPQGLLSNYGGSAIYGNWVNKTNKYLGLKLTVGTQVYYGWARLDVDSLATTFTIKDYAYRNNPDQPIVAGMMTDVGVKENALADNVVMFSCNKNITIKLSNDFPADGVIRVTNALGQEITKFDITSREMNVNLEDKKAGVYFVTILHKGTVYTRKISLN